MNNGGFDWEPLAALEDLGCLRVAEFGERLLVQEKACGFFSG
jgi:hypothetical protein